MVIFKIFLTSLVIKNFFNENVVANKNLVFEAPDERTSWNAVTDEDDTIDCDRVLATKEPDRLTAEYASWKPKRTWSNAQLKALLGDCTKFTRQFTFKNS